ncbi:MAG: AbrB/MazE/SpoVT family DNA-binding domain-containing protein [Defluviitaleaceae bacterium]|nr:AbrB/MazE/SpoVT family DNA-binding domain-containing protein [Defluviitaleaceae bacterium]
MENLGTKTIDELSRIILPKEVRQLKGWAIGDRITFYNYNGIIVIEKSEQIQESEHYPIKPTA